MLFEKIQNFSEQRLSPKLQFSVQKTEETYRDVQHISSPTCKGDDGMIGQIWSPHNGHSANFDRDKLKLETSGSAGYSVSEICSLFFNQGCLRNQE